MASRHLVLPENAPGVSLEPDFRTGVVTITIRRPFDVEPIVVQVPMVDILESAAHMTLTMCAIQKNAKDT